LNKPSVKQPSEDGLIKLRLYMLSPAHSQIITLAGLLV